MTSASGVAGGTSSNNRCFVGVPLGNLRDEGVTPNNSRATDATFRNQATAGPQSGNQRARETTLVASALFGFDAATLVDAHVHMDFMSNMREVADDAASRGLCLFANTVTPQGYERTRAQLGDLPNVRVGLGLHPRWVAEGLCDETDVALFDQLVSSTRWIGEVGLDFSARYVADGARELQVAAFRRVARAAAQAGDRVLSIHAVRSVGTVLDALEESGCLARCSCILHWFSGSTDDLWRAIRAGCWFSVNERQVRTRRAKEQLKLIPHDCLMLETDLPPAEGVVFSANEIEASLWRTLSHGTLRSQN